MFMFSGDTSFTFDSICVALQATELYVICVWPGEENLCPSLGKKGWWARGKAAVTTCASQSQFALVMALSR